MLLNSSPFLTWTSIMLNPSSFKGESSRDAYSLRSTRTRFWACNYCKECFQSNFAYLNHWMRVHGPGSSFWSKDAYFGEFTVYPNISMDFPRRFHSQIVGPICILLSPDLALFLCRICYSANLRFVVLPSPFIQSFVLP